MPSRYLVHGLGKLKPKDTESWRQYTERSKARCQLLTPLPQQQKCIIHEVFSVCILSRQRSQLPVFYSALVFKVSTSQIHRKVSQREVQTRLMF